MKGPLRVTEVEIRQAEDLILKLKGKRILVVGDVMLDRYVWGQVSRMSPEAPVPVVEVENEAIRLGGAANVAANVVALGAEPLLVGLVGPSGPATDELLDLLEAEGLSREGLLEDPDRHTSVKTRIIAHQQHVVRADWEDKAPAEGAVAAGLCDFVAGVLEGVDAVILQDYNKGVLSSTVLNTMLPKLRESGLPVTVDPKFERFFEYTGVTVFKPNLKEVEAALGTRLSDDENVAEAARMLLRRLEAENVLITRGELGMTLLETDGTLTHVSTHARHVFDVSGAGDTVVATLTSVLAAGGSVREAAALANYAAGVVVSEVGVVVITSEGLLQAVTEGES